MASAEELGDLFANLPAGEKWKFMRQFTSVRSRDEKHGVEPAPAKKAVNGFMAFRCKSVWIGCGTMELIFYQHTTRFYFQGFSKRSAPRFSGDSTMLTLSTRSGIL
jgi:hypothetical protein